MFLSLRVACGSTIQFKYILSYFSMSRASPNVFGYLRLEYPYVYFVFFFTSFHHYECWQKEAHRRFIMQREEGFFLFYERPEFVVQGYHFQSIINADHIDDFSSEEEKEYRSLSYLFRIGSNNTDWLRINI